MAIYRPRSIGEYVHILLTRKFLLLLAAGSMFAATILVIHRLPDTYQSQASIVVTDTGEGRELASGRVASVVERLSSREFLTPLIDKYRLYGDAARKGSLEGALATMRKDTSVDTKYRGDFPEMVTVSYKYPDSKLAKQVADDMVSVFSNMNDAIVAQVNKQLQAADQGMTDIEGKLQSISRSKSAADSAMASLNRAESRYSAIRAQKIAESNSAEELASKQYALEQQIAEQKRQIEQQEKLVKAAPASGSDKGTSYGALLVKKAELEGQIQLYSAQYTDKNPKMIEAKTQLDALEQEIQKYESKGAGTANTGSPDSRELRAMQRDLAKMEIEHEVNARELDLKRKALGPGPIPADAGPVGTSVASISPESGTAEGLKTQYGFLLNRKDAYDKQQVQTAGLDPGIFQIVDSPAQAAMPSGPNRVKLILLALGLSLVFGLIAIAAVEAPRLTSINNVPDIEYYLDSPVIALIPESLTPVESRRSRRIRMLRAVGSIALAAVLVPVFVVVFNYLQVFQTLANH